jgi:hypothetical protein
VIRVMIVLVLATVLGLPLACAPALAADPAPRVERAGEYSDWEIVFPDDTKPEEYARQLDFFQIEIGAASRDGKVEYISKVGQPKPDKRVGQAAEDDRYHIGWKKGKLHAVDRRLLGKAGINSRDKQLLHYLPHELHKQLEELEKDYAGRQRGEINRTRFEIRPKDRYPGYEFIVVEQDPPKPADNGTTQSPSRPSER